MSEYVTIARPYAQAAFDFAKEHNAVDDWLAMISFMKAVVTEDSVSEAIKSSNNSASILEMLKTISDGYVDEYFLNFLRQIVENERLAVMPDILEEFERLKDEDERILKAQVVSVEKLPKNEMEKIQAFLEGKYQCSVVLSNIIDTDILGGVVIRTPKEVIDASIRSRIDELTDVLKS